MLACPSPKCGSTNVQQLAHYWHSLPGDSPLKAKYAPPAEVSSQAWIALAAVAVGIVLLVNGTVLAGLLVAIGGLGFGVFDRREVAVYHHSRAAWEADRICLGCTGRF